MPEGDTIHKLATYLAPRLEGRRLAGSHVQGDPTLNLAGVRVERVEARGKHLFIQLGNDRTLRSHLGMHGTWHAYTRGERWKLPERRASIVLATEAEVFVCFDAQEVDLMRTRGARARSMERRLGPDLTAESAPEMGEVVKRARALSPPEAPVVDVLLNQEIACGIGNVYKSETLFLESIAPLEALGRLEDADLRRVFERGRRLLRANLGGGPRITRHSRDGAGRLWVYGRAGEPCFRCGTRVTSARLGRDRRTTAWCPACQPTRVG